MVVYQCFIQPVMLSLFQHDGSRPVVTSLQSIPLGNLRGGGEESSGIAEVLLMRARLLRARESDW